MKETNYFFTDPSNEVVGPVTYGELVVARQRGQIADETPVIEEGATDWHTCAHYFPKPTCPPPAPPPIRQATFPAVLGPALTDESCSSRRPVKTLALIAGVVLAALISMVVRGKTGRRVNDRNSEPAPGDIAHTQIPATWKFVAYEGKHVPYRFFLPDFWTEVERPPDDNADRAFAGPHGLVLSLYQIGNITAFEAGLRKSMPDAQMYSVGTQSFISATPVNGVRMVREMALTQYGPATLAVTMRAPVELPQSIVNAAVFDAGYSIGYSHAAYGNPDRPNAFDAQPRAHSVLLTELSKWDEIDRTTGAVVSRPGTVSKEQYKARLSFYFGWSVGDKLIADADWFQRVMGRPVRTQTMQMGRDASTLWYYECADGTIQLAAEARALANGGQLRATLNDY